MRAVVGVRERELSWPKAIAATLAGAALTGVCAQMGFYLPGNYAVPVTMQVFAVVLCGMLLGPRLAVLAQLEYLAMGAAGLPVFSCFRGGWLMLAGPTGGYIVGFVAMAFVTGTLAGQARNSLHVTYSRTRIIDMLIVAGLAGVVTLYVFGTAWLAIWLKDASQLAWLLGAVPFVLFDIAKVAAAALIASRRR